jgi:hypothetical protein
MDLSAAQRKAVFGLVVVVLVGLGVYLFVSAARGGSPAAASHRPAQHHTAQHHTAAAAPSPTPSQGTSVPVSAGSATGPDIYQWLPFTQAQLGSAASVVTEFCNAYGTWSYGQNAGAYAATMRNLATSELSQVIEQGFAAPGVAAQRTAKKQVSTASAVINSLRAFGPTSITLVVTIDQEITDTAGRSPVTGQYAVTVVAVGTGWRVNDIELAAAGNP